MFATMKFMLRKEERLKSKKLIGRLYSDGKSIKVFPLKMVYLQVESFPSFYAQMGVSVPKRNFKRAVDRNKIKRLLRENYRLKKNIIYSNINGSYVFMISYLAKEEWSYESISKKMTKLLTSFISDISESKNS